MDHYRHHHATLAVLMRSWRRMSDVHYSTKEVAEALGWSVDFTRARLTEMARKHLVSRRESPPRGWRAYGKAVTPSEAAATEHGR